MNNVDIGIDFGITNSDVVISANNNFSYKSLRSEKNIHLSLNNIIKKRPRRVKNQKYLSNGGETFRSS